MTCVAVSVELQHHLCVSQAIQGIRTFTHRAIQAARYVQLAYTGLDCPLVRGLDTTTHYNELSLGFE